MSLPAISLPLDFEDAEPASEDDVELLDPEVVGSPSDERPHLVFLISGIRSSGWWAQALRREEVIWDGRAVEFVPIRGNGGNFGRLSSFHLVSRLFLQSFRSYFLAQMQDLSRAKDYASINIVAHSMGSALLADIVTELVRDLHSSGRKLNLLAFVGSVCGRKHCRTLSQSCCLFVNDVGLRDYLPYLASIVRPDAYSDVGTFGFLDGYPYDRFFNHNHESCTSSSHILENVVPLIAEIEVRPLGLPSGLAPDDTLFVYLRRLIWVIAIIAPLSLWFLL